jgi:hypothetical protein
MALLDAFQTPERTRLARATLAKLRVIGGGPPFVKLGTNVLYDQTDVAAWIAAQGKRRSTSDRRAPPRVPRRPLAEIP